VPRFTYKDWVGRKAVCRVAMQNKAHTIHFKKGEIVEVTNYDRWMQFSIKKGKRTLIKVTPQDIRLVENPRETLRTRILTYIRRATIGASDYWPTATVIAKGLGEELSVISSMLHSMSEDMSLRREKYHGPRGGYGYRLFDQDDVARVSRYDWLMKDQDDV